MRIINDSVNSPVSSATADPTMAYCATIGFFDGVHQGHRFLLQQVAQAARDRGLSTMAITFGEHPRQTLQSDYQPLLLTTPNEKLNLLSSCGLDACTVLHFTKEMAEVSAYDFMKEYLYNRFRVRCLVIGYDHHFGRRSNEGFEDYKAYGQEIGIEVLLATPLQNEEFTVSSSVIRRFLTAGNVEKAQQCLERPYHLHGTVSTGHQMGRKLGFPTANLILEHPYLLVPAHGVYAIYAETEGKRYPAMLNIGCRPTVNNGKNNTIEAHLFGFDGNLYGKELTLYFMHRLREEKKFESLEQLQAQLNIDAEQTLQLLSPC